MLDCVTLTRTVTEHDLISLDYVLRAGGSGLPNLRAIRFSDLCLDFTEPLGGHYGAEYLSVLHESFP